MPLISVKGNRFVDPDGKPVLFRGLAISDPDKLEKQGHWNKEHFVKVKEMGTTLLRIPVHPVAWRERGGSNTSNCSTRPWNGPRTWACTSSSTGTPSAT